MNRSSSLSSGSSDASLEPINLESGDGWEDLEPDNEVLQVISLFDDEIFPDVHSMLEYCQGRYQFDFVALVKKNGYEFYDCIKLVNYIRSEVKNGNLKPNLESKELFQDDKYLQPVLPDDPVLFGLDDVLQLAGQDVQASIVQPEDITPEAYQEALSRVSLLEQQLLRTQAEFSEYKGLVETTLDQRWNSKPTSAAPGDGDISKSIPRDDDTHYFASYAYNDIHEIMLKDAVRTSAYRDFIYDNKHLFAGKVVLDVGCGTGILSMFCAKAGAKQVIAVDNSDIIDKAREIVFENELSNVITCLRGKVEEVQLPVTQVDIIVSEWMGYCLLYEAMLDSVLWARDRYLSPTGLMVPSFATIQLAPVSDPDYVSDSVAFWHEVYGFRMGAMLEKIHDDVHIRNLKVDSIAATPSFSFAHLPLHTVTKEDLANIKAEFDFSLNTDVDSLDAFAIWFDILFQTTRDEIIENADTVLETWKRSHPKGIAFTTGPYGEPTHWQSGMLLVNHGNKQAQPLKKGQRLKGNIQYKKRETNSRELEVDMQWQVAESNEAGKQMWVMQ